MMTNNLPPLCLDPKGSPLVQILNKDRGLCKMVDWVECRVERPTEIIMGRKYWFAGGTVDSCSITVEGKHNCYTEEFWVAVGDPDDIVKRENRVVHMEDGTTQIWSHSWRVDDG